MSSSAPPERRRSGPRARSRVWLQWPFPPPTAGTVVPAPGIPPAPGTGVGSPGTPVGASAAPDPAAGAAAEPAPDPAPDPCAAGAPPRVLGRPKTGSIVGLVAGG